MTGTAIASGYRIFCAATRGSACAMGECVRYGFTRIMPIYCLEFDLFEKSVWFGGKIEYCAICPYMAWVSGSSPDHPKKNFFGSWVQNVLRVMFL